MGAKRCGHSTQPVPPTSVAIIGPTGQAAAHGNAKRDSSKRGVLRRASKFTATGLNVGGVHAKLGGKAPASWNVVENEAGKGW